ncbi:MAG: 2-dehydro-3-deoxygalactonokinase [Blastocatellia bacterium]
MLTATENFCAVCIDAGTTSTRVWLVRGTEIIARAKAMTGVRDTAREGSNEKLRAVLRDLIAEVCRQGAASDPAFVPACVIAAGMITSPLGLAEVPHVAAPAGTGELRAGVRRFHFPDITDLPVLLVPGVRSGAPQTTVESIGRCDVMRGEETLCAGLVASARISSPSIVLNFGSHWKAIQLDGDGRMAGSVTSLSGEMIHAVQTTTILASAVPAGRPEFIDPVWCAAGMREQRQSGLARALFCVRLLEVQNHGTPEQRMAFLTGAFVAAELDAWQAQGVPLNRMSVLIVGSGALAKAWQHALTTAGSTAEVLSEAESETAFLTGLRAIAQGVLTSP